MIPIHVIAVGVSPGQKNASPVPFEQGLFCLAAACHEEECGPCIHPHTPLHEESHPSPSYAPLSGMAALMEVVSSETSSGISRPIRRPSDLSPTSAFEFTGAVGQLPPRVIPTTKKLGTRLEDEPPRADTGPAPKKREHSKGFHASRHERRDPLAPIDGVFRCEWDGCESPGFASLTELGGHIRGVHIAGQKQENRIYKLRGSRCYWKGCDRPWDTPFNSFYNLEMHIRFLHTGERPFACEFPGCGLAFSQSSDLTSHMGCHNVDGQTMRRKSAGTKPALKKGKFTGGYRAREDDGDDEYDPDHVNPH